MKKYFFLIVSCLIVPCGIFLGNVYASPIDFTGATLRFTHDLTLNTPVQTNISYTGSVWEDLGFSDINIGTYISDGNSAIASDITSITLFPFEQSQISGLSFTFDYGIGAGIMFLGNSEYNFNITKDLISGGATFVDTEIINTSNYQNLHATPEPSAILLFGFGLLCLAGKKRAKT